MGSIFTKVPRSVSKEGVNVIKAKLAFTLVSIIAVVCLLFNIVLWRDLQNQKRQYDDVVYTQASMNFRSSLKTAAGYLNVGSTPDYRNDAVFVHQASSDLEILNDSLSSAGVPYVAQISTRLGSVANDFINSKSTSTQRLSMDTAYIQEVYDIVETKCYPKGQIQKSAFPAAFAQIYTISQ